MTDDSSVATYRVECSCGWETTVEDGFDKEGAYTIYKSPRFVAQDHALRSKIHDTTRDHNVTVSEVVTT